MGSHLPCCCGPNMVKLSVRLDLKQLKRPTFFHILFCGIEGSGVVVVGGGLSRGAGSIFSVGRETRKIK